MIKDYLYTLGKYLPRREKGEILREIEGNIYDYLESHFGEKATYSKEELQEALIKLGDPRQVARNYLDRSPGLIGPPLLDSYYLLLRIVLLSYSLGILIARGLGYLENKNPSAGFYLDALLELILGLLIAYGLVTLGFALLYRYRPGFSLEEEWTLNELERAPEATDNFSPGEGIARGGFSLLVLLLLILKPAYLPVKPLELGAHYGGLLTVIGINFIFYSYLLIEGKKNKGTRLASGLINFLGVYILWIISNHLGFFDFARFNISVGEVLELEKALNLGLKIASGVLLILTGMEFYRYLGESK